MKSTVIEEFVSTKPGEAYRLLPFGRITKNGNSREITPEYAAKFKLPHFKPPVKLGSHEEVTPAGGHIVGLEVREDGLYAVPEWNDKGASALNEGAYRYHSPEIIWDEGAFEDPATGAMITGPLIVGDALLHMPHLGEAAKLYSVEQITQGETQMENVSIPANFFSKLVEKFSAPAPEKQIVEVVPEDYEAVKAAAKERDQLVAQLEATKLEAARKSRIEKFEGELKETKADPTLAELLADLPEDKSGAIMKQFRALSEQIKDANLTGELGNESKGNGLEDPKAEFNALVLAVVKDSKINYNAAFEVVKNSHPDLFKQVFSK